MTPLDLIPALERGIATKKWIEDGRALDEANTARLNKPRPRTQSLYEDGARSMGQRRAWLSNLTHAVRSEVAKRTDPDQEFLIGPWD